MGLVEYSDSEGSEAETSPPVIQKTNVSSKSKFQKVVDRSNPGKIKVTLPSISPASPDESLANDGPPAKKPKLGGGFNSFLPAPKRTGITAAANGSKKGLSSHVSLKTSAEPGFSREPLLTGSIDEQTPPGGEATGISADQILDVRLANTIGTADRTSHVQKEPIAPVKRPMFKPLSVSAGKKKKKASSTAISAPKGDKTLTEERPKDVVPEIPLFSLEPAVKSNLAAESNGHYVPMLYQNSVDELDGNEYQDQDELTGLDHHENPREISTNPQAVDSSSQLNSGSSQSLESIASDLNLSKSAMRQLLGRRGGNRDAMQTASTITVKNFNTDEEYKANEVLRQAGEAPTHNPVRSIAPGKHSLQQLVSAVSTQKDALEDSFASGRRNKAEAGSKYGW